MPCVDEDCVEGGSDDREVVDEDACDAVDVNAADGEEDDDDDVHDDDDEIEVGLGTGEFEVELGASRELDRRTEIGAAGRSVRTRVTSLRLTLPFSRDDFTYTCVMHPPFWQSSFTSFLPTGTRAHARAREGSGNLCPYRSCMASMCVLISVRISCRSFSSIPVRPTSPSIWEW